MNRPERLKVPELFDVERVRLLPDPCRLNEITELFLTDANGGSKPVVFQVALMNSLVNCANRHVESVSDLLRSEHQSLSYGWP